MSRSDRSTDRPQLRFEESVLSAFGFLTKPTYGFKCVDSDSTLVRYESAAVFVNIYHGRNSFELGCEIGLRVGRDGPLHGGGIEEERPEEGFTIWEIARLENASGIDHRTFLQASTTERVEQLVTHLSELVRKHAARALQGDPFCYDRLRQARSDWFHSYMLDSRIERARADVARAWQRKNFAEVVRLFEPIYDALTPAECKKLEYARRHAVSSP